MKKPTKEDFQSFKDCEMDLLELRLQCFNLGFDLSINKNGWVVFPFELYKYDTTEFISTFAKTSDIKSYIEKNRQYTLNYKITDLINL